MRFKIEALPTLRLQTAVNGFDKFQRALYGGACRLRVVLPHRGVDHRAERPTVGIGAFMHIEQYSGRIVGVITGFAGSGR